MNKIQSLIICFIFLIAVSQLDSQVDHVPLTDPVYDYLLRAESKGYMEHSSLSQLPLQRKEIVNVLMSMKENSLNLSSSDLNLIDYYLRDLNALEEENTVVFENEKYDDQIFFKNLVSSKDKYFYKYKDSNSIVNVKPLAKAEFFATGNDEFEENNSLVIQGGVRLFGTLDDQFGYYLQITNGANIVGSKELSIAREPRYGKNVKFAFLDSDLDFTQSHLRYDNDWFYATIGRESRLVGAGLDQRVFVSTASPEFDALSLGARFTSFEYRFTHASLLAIPNDTNIPQGFNAVIPDKFLASHRFAFRPSWGEIAFWEGVIYSERSIDLAYLNPLSFYKSLEHALRDRDNSLMGIDATIRPFNGMQLKGSFLLDDIIIEEIGNRFWSNKSAWNIAGVYSFDFPVDVGVEYSRVEPYTYTHFNTQNSYTNDMLPIGSTLLPNSDIKTLLLNFWWDSKYPISAKFSLKRHGENVYDEEGNLIKNVGGDILQTRRPQDSEQVTFLDGNLVESMVFELSAGYEIFRNFNIKASYSYEDIAVNNHYVKLILSLEDF